MTDVQMLINATGADRIARERSRQLSAKGYTPAHDDEHIGGELVTAAIAYAEITINPCCEDPDRSAEMWPFSDGWNPSEDPIRNLERAGALIAAEIDRLQRMRAGHGWPDVSLEDIAKWHRAQQRALLTTAASRRADDDDGQFEVSGWQAMATKHGEMAARLESLLS